MVSHKKHHLTWIAAEHEGECAGPPSRDHDQVCTHKSHWQYKEQWRANYVPAPAYFTLNHCCKLINDAFDGFGCYLVGSSLHRRDFRDVDIRFIMDDDQFTKLFHEPHGGATNAMWSLLCITISQWLSSQTGLQVDFQFQNRSHANEKYGNEIRNAMGLFLDYPGETPTDVKA